MLHANSITPVIRITSTSVRPLTTLTCAVMLKRHALTANPTRSTMSTAKLGGRTPESKSIEDSATSDSVATSSFPIKSPTKPTKAPAIMLSSVAARKTAISAVDSAHASPSRPIRTYGARAAVYQIIFAAMNGRDSAINFASEHTRRRTRTVQTSAINWSASNSEIKQYLARLGQGTYPILCTRRRCRRRLRGSRS